MAVSITKPAFNIRDKLAEIGANIATSQMPSGTIINTAYSEYNTQVHILSLIHISEPTRPERIGDGGVGV